MKALSLWQPWATLIAIGAKEYETRSWGTSHRGPLVIHAAKTDEGLGSFYNPTIEKSLNAAGFKLSAALPRGCALCVVQLVGCWEMTPAYIARMSEQERAFGDWQPGRFAWQLIKPQPFDKPIPMRGMQGLFSVELPD